MAKFLDFHRSKGGRFVDWAAAWRTWQRNAKDWSRPQGPAPRRDPRGELQPFVEPGTYKRILGDP